MKPITKGFLIIGVLLLCFLVWSLVFEDGGVLALAWNAIANEVNGMYQDITGSTNELMPLWVVETDLSGGKTGGHAGGGGGGGSTGP